MKILIALPCVVALALCARVAVAAEPAGAAKAHRVVFQVTTDSPEQWEAMLGNVENLREAPGPENMEVLVVAHGKGLGLLRAAGNPVVERMGKLAGGGRTVFAACENTMRKKKVTKAELLPFATTVDAGVAEVVRRQEQGWSYIKSGD